MSLKEQLAEYRADWFKRVPAERQAVIERHVNELRNGLAKTALKAGDRAPAIVLTNAKDETVDRRNASEARTGHRVILSRRLVSLLQS
jgi:hypothetical protein